MKNTLQDFDASLAQLKQDEREGKELSQNHFGDYLMIEEPKEWKRNGDNYKVWLSHPNNVAEGQAKWQIEFAGPRNGYKWKTIAEGNE